MIKVPLLKNETILLETIFCVSSKKTGIKIQNYLKMFTRSECKENDTESVQNLGHECKE